VQGSSVSKHGTASILGSIYKSEGVLGLFRGNMANVFRVAPCTAFEFTLFDILKYQADIIPGVRKLNTQTKLFLAGCISGCVSYALVYPIDVVKTVHSLGLYEGKSVVGTLKSLIYEHGIRRCYRGLLATCCVSFILNCVHYVQFYLNFVTPPRGSLHTQE
jgi:Mitochondrial carrier protein